MSDLTMSMFLRKEDCAEARGWQTMDTHPDKPMPVELFSANLPRRYGWSDDIWKGPRDERRQIGWWDGENFCVNGTGHEAFESWHMHEDEAPTHWRRLPEPPQ